MLGILTAWMNTAMVCFFVLLFAIKYVASQNTFLTQIRCCIKYVGHWDCWAAKEATCFSVAGENRVARSNTYIDMYTYHSLYTNHSIAARLASRSRFIFCVNHRPFSRTVAHTLSCTCMHVFRFSQRRMHHHSLVNSIHAYLLNHRHRVAIRK